MGATDLAIAIPILLGATALLYRSFRRKGGPCAGCGGCGSRARCGPEVTTLRRPH
ncbi:MAG TPA: hypothetical protein VD838_13510 [Anaeromyxobacteraceae bacterium]|nr:hypothetical protein [Anaeromyxobacteraceae bacterium]